MFRCFRSSRAVFRGGLVLTALLAVLIVPSTAHSSIWKAAIYSAIILGVGYCVALISGQIVASFENNKRMRILHIELEPEKYIAAYEKIPCRLNRASADYAICTSYLADGYCAAGEFERTLETLSHTYRKTRNQKRNAAIASLTASCNCNYLLWMGRAKESAEALRELESVLRSARTVNSALADNMSTRVSEYRMWLDFLEQRDVDSETLSAMAAREVFRLRKLELQTLLARVYETRDEIERAKQTYRTVSDEGKDTFAARFARERLAEIG